MDAEVARLVESGATALGGLLATDAYERALRPRLAGLLRHGRPGWQLPDIEHFDRMRNDLSVAGARGDERVQRVIARELRGYVRSMIDADPVAVADPLASVREEPEGGSGDGVATVSLLNNTIIGAAQGSGLQHNSFQR